MHQSFARKRHCVYRWLTPALAKVEWMVRPQAASGSALGQTADSHTAPLTAAVYSGSQRSYSVSTPSARQAQAQAKPKPSADRTLCPPWHASHSGVAPSAFGSHSAADTTKRALGNTNHANQESAVSAIAAPLTFRHATEPNALRRTVTVQHVRSQLLCRGLCSHGCAKASRAAASAAHP